MVHLSFVTQCFLKRLNLHAFWWANSLHVRKFRPTFLGQRLVGGVASPPLLLPAILTCSLCLTSRRNRLTSGAEGVQWMLAVGIHRWSATMPHVRHRPLGRVHADSVQRGSQQDGQHYIPMHLLCVITTTNETEIWEKIEYSQLIMWS